MNNKNKSKEFIQNLYRAIAKLDEGPISHDGGVDSPIISPGNPKDDDPGACCVKYRDGTVTSVTSWWQYDIEWIVNKWTDKNGFRATCYGNITREECGSHFNPTVFDEDNPPTVGQHVHEVASAVFKEFQSCQACRYNNLSVDSDGIGNEGYQKETL